MMAGLSFQQRFQHFIQLFGAAIEQDARNMAVFAEIVGIFQGLTCFVDTVKNNVTVRMLPVGMPDNQILCIGCLLYTSTYEQFNLSTF